MSDADTKAKSRYSWGADEHLVVELSESMSLTTNFTGLAMSRSLAERGLDGILDICPANASLLIRFDPDRLDPQTLESTVRDIEADVAHQTHPSIRTRLIEVPVWYDDPYTREVGARFRDHHQRPEGTDIEYAVAELGLATVGEFITRHSRSPWLVSMVGFVAGLPFMYQMVERDQQMQFPKYLRPRTETPKHTVGHGGCFACIYSVKGAGGYQMFGVTPLPIYQPEQSLPEFSDSMVLFRPGDIVKFRPIAEPEYQNLVADVERGGAAHRIVEVDFELDKFLGAPGAYNTHLLEALEA